jgi:hypothetical protein
MPVMLVLVLAMPALLGGRIGGGGGAAAADAVIAVGGEAGRCQEHQKACSQADGKKLENGHDRDTLAGVPAIPVKSP